MLWHLLVFALVTASLKLPQKTSLLALTSLTALFVMTLISGQNLAGRAIGTLGEPNALAATAVFLLPFAFFSKNLPLKVSGVLFTLTIVLFSGSRSGFVGFTIEGIFIMLRVFKLAIKPATIFTLLLLVLSLILPFIEAKTRSNLPQFRFENRVEIWQASFYSGFTSPIYGHGFGKIKKVLNPASVELNNNVQYQFVDSSHNIFLDFWVQGGIIGILILTSLLALSIKGMLAKDKVLELTALIGVLTALSFNPASVSSLVALWWLISRGFSKEKLG